ncbi:VOC family protein [Dickeya fangzhongdai]
MFSHIILGARDIDLMVRFYAAILEELGFVPVEEEPGGPVGQGWHIPGRRWPQFYVQVPFNGLPATWGNGTQVSFAVSSPQVVRHVWQTALSLGGADEGAPGLRPHYAPDYYGAYCRDPEGNKLCFVYTPEFDNTVGGLA